MKRFQLTAVLAIAGAVVSSDKADAQVYYNYNTRIPGGVVGNSFYATPFGARTGASYYSPWTGAINRQGYYSNIYGTQGARAFGYNPATHFGYSRGYVYNPGGFNGLYYNAPYARNYNYIFRR